MNRAQPFQFVQRDFPSANMVLVRAGKTVLIDTGFGSDADATERLLAEAGAAPDAVDFIVNTHGHCDHSGGNHRLQGKWGLPVWAQEDDAREVNGRERDACNAFWLGQPLESYRVNETLKDGDRIDLGGLSLQVLHSPGHSRNQICLYCPEERVLILGDALHRDDAGWLNPFTEGERPVENALASLDRLLSLDVARAFSGHGPAIENFPAAAAAARGRYESWRRAPEKMAWHAIKRVLAYAVMLEDGMTRARAADYLLAAPWHRAYSEDFFHADLAAFAETVLDESLRTGALLQRDGLLFPQMDYVAPKAGWLDGEDKPGLWRD